MPSIAIVTPVYQGAEFVAATIRSVLAQSFQDWEYIIMDGGSTDDTLRIAEEAAEGDPRIHIISRRDGGMYDAVVSGLELTSAPICCWLNADDMLLPWAFAIVMQHMTTSGIEWLTGIPALWNEEGQLFHVGYAMWKPRRLMRWGLHHSRGIGFIQQESTFFSRALLKRVPKEKMEIIRKTKLAGDSILWREFAAFSELHNVATVVSGFRFHAKNASSDMRAYFAELRLAEFTLPGRYTSLFLKAAFGPIALLVGHVRAKRLQHRVRPEVTRWDELRTQQSRSNANVGVR